MLDLNFGVMNGWLFMSVFILQMLVMMFADEKVQQRTHIPAEARHNQFEKSISIIANVVWFFALIYSLFLPLRPDHYLFYIGLIVFVIGTYILATATMSFMSTPPDKLITKGIYRYSRHPMYLSTFLICLGTGTATLSWIYIFITLLIVICFRQEALLEERICIEQYGNEYRDYMERHPRWLGIPK